MLIPVPAASVQKALHEAASQPAVRPQPRLVNAAHEFEAQLMKELLKPLGSGNDDDGEGGGGVLGEFAGEALGRAISNHGGFGIADRLVSQLAREPAKQTGAEEIRKIGNE